ncbi:peptide-methionine (S)-S-oxide reductase [Alteribacillus sp. JSM 102045]|uniref:peptide-methionine (S)-S-oxide reductase n=1 Tax=Alteribacillus sp. JSM 102045 TaxID=1562101 RepID=UPI0035C0C4F5
MQGVISTRVGYTGGTKENPTYRNIGDHTESIQIDFDPEVISYEQLLKIFWENHNLLQKLLFRNRQYMSLLVYHNDSQKEKALYSKDKWEEKEGKEIQTEFQPFTVFI